MQNNVSFSSRIKPVSPTLFHSKNGGNILIREISQEDEIPEVAHFACDMAEKAHETLTPKEKKLFIKDSIWDLRNSLQNDPNSTILVATDQNKKIVGVNAVVTQEIFPQVGEIYAMYISPLLQGEGLGKKMMGMLIDSGKGSFSDIFVCAENKAVGFYKDNGFDFTPKPAKDPLNKIIRAIRNCWTDKNCMKIGSINFNS